MPDTLIKEFAGGRLRLLRQGSIATLELHQPSRRNAMSQSMWSAFPEVIAAVATDTGIRVMVVRGNGGTFSAGADTSEFDQVYATAESTGRYNTAVRRAQADLRNLSRPTIAAIEGGCMGGGCGVALACDFRFADSTARFAITPARMGLAYSLEDTAQLVEKVGAARAKDMLFSGRQLNATEAMAFGLIDRLVEPEQLPALVADYATELSERSQTSIRAAKTMINSLGEPGENQPVAALARQSFDGEDFREGYSAYLEKRAPKFA